MSEAQDETSLVEPPGDGDAGPAPRAEPPQDDRLVEELEEQERGGWPGEPTTG